MPFYRTFTALLPHSPCYPKLPVSSAAAPPVAYAAIKLQELSIKMTQPTRFSFVDATLWQNRQRPLTYTLSRYYDFSNISIGHVLPTEQRRTEITPTRHLIRLTQLMALYSQIQTGSKLLSDSFGGASLLTLAHAEQQKPFWEAQVQRAQLVASVFASLHRAVAKSDAGGPIVEAQITGAVKLTSFIDRFRDAVGKRSTVATAYDSSAC
ncbi:hypothetical protein BDFG_01138 [Blastomyces dermatitidis ATCC 26199]|nr:hypothetical protein BDFG_01138 [Blastomyces dermatitidis ATCC 26199]